MLLEISRDKSAEISVDAGDSAEDYRNRLARSEVLHMHLLTLPTNLSVDLNISRLGTLEPKSSTDTSEITQHAIAS